MGYGNDEMLLATRRMILERMGYRVCTAVSFSDALLVLMNHEINLLVLCQPERRAATKVFTWKLAPGTSTRNEMRGTRVRGATWIRACGCYPCAVASEVTPLHNRKFARPTDLLLSPNLLSFGWSCSTTCATTDIDVTGIDGVGPILFGGRKFIPTKRGGLFISSGYLPPPPQSEPPQALAQRCHL